MSNEYRLNIDADRAMIEIIAESSVSLDSLMKSQTETEKLVKEHGLRKALINAESVDHAPGLPELISFGQGLLKSPVLSKLRLAVVGVSVGGFQVQMVKSITQNMGFEVDLFKTREEALAWLDEAD